ncbi:MAG: dihydroneopterin aldolase [Lentisphaerae bacterium]|nr:dihydroneopterin aldolase [Lentisphaerota bacterium]
MNELERLQSLAFLDKISIVRLRCSGIIGCKPKERLQPQVLYVSLDVYFCTRAAAAADDLQLTVNYARLSKELLALVNASRFQLIESLAEAMARHCLQEYPIEAVRVRIDKPAGIAAAEGASLEITRLRQETPV